MFGYLIVNARGGSDVEIEMFSVLSSMDSQEIFSMGDGCGWRLPTIDHSFFETYGRGASVTANGGGS